MILHDGRGRDGGPYAILNKQINFGGKEKKDRAERNLLIINKVSSSVTTTSSLMSNGALNHCSKLDWEENM